MPLHAPVIALLVVTGRDAAAAEPTPERPLLPAMSSAGEDGAATLWANPAAFGFDPDPSAWLGWSQSLQQGGGAGTVSGALQQGPLAAGVSYRLGGGAPSWLTVGSGLGLPLGRRVAMGVGFGWQIPEGPDDNFLTWDFGVGWRPAQWLGVSLVAENLNDPAPELGVLPRYGGGVAWRPAQGRLVLAVDYRQEGLTSQETGFFSASARVEPTDGLVLRLYADQEGQVGGGAEVFWGRTGAGAHARLDLPDATDPQAMAYVLTGDGDKSIFDSGRRVPEFVLDDSFPYQPRTGLFVRTGETWLHLLQRIESAIDDPRVQGIVFHVDQRPASFARVEELRGLAARARAAGKLTVAYLDRDAGNAAYMVAVACDRVYLHPAADLDLKGISLELTYLRGTLDLIGVEPQFVRRGEYKSAPEQWTRSGSSEPAREQLDALLDDFSGALHQAIADGRSKQLDQVARLVDRGPFTAEEAEQRDLVDGLIYPDQLERTVEQAFGRRLSVDDEYHLDDEVTGWPAAREIAVLYVDGVITSGSSSEGGLLSGRTAGSDTLVRQLDRARRDDAVQAVVLRVDSPGGSAFASDEIWRATQRLQQAGKPLIVSMGGVAASGGYYVAAGADAIYAEPGTITGSIGVYGGKLSFGGLMDKVGVETEIMTRGRHAAMDSTSRPMDASELEALERLIDATYDQFKDRVARGRGMTADEVEEVARGRVWSGAQAKELGLVDELGGFDAAIERARREAGMGENTVVELVTYGDRPDGSVPRRTVQAAARALVGVAASPPPSFPLLDGVAADLAIWTRLAEDPTWAMMPWRIDVR